MSIDFGMCVLATKWSPTQRQEVGQYTRLGFCQLPLVYDYFLFALSACLTDGNVQIAPIEGTDCFLAAPQPQIHGLSR